MKKAVKFFTRLCEAYLPDAYVFSLVLTLVVYILAWFMTPHSSSQLVQFWGKDFWSLNGFAMQMVFVLISGHMLASTPLIKSFLQKICTLARTEAQGLILLSLVSTLACFLNWGFGLIVSGILALEMARKLGKVNFGLFVATAYASFIVWHGGISGSIPLKIAGGDEILQQVFPGLSISLALTIFSGWNLILVLLLLILLPLLALTMRTEEKQTVNFTPSTPKEDLMPASFRAKLENLKLLNFIFFGAFVFLISSSLMNGETLDINRVNMIFLGLAVLFHQTPKRFLGALTESFPYAASIVIQFPFYAGIMGLMQHSGLADRISELFVMVSSQHTLPMLTFLSGGLVNFFIPSGGGQWVVQGPIMLKAARDLGADPAKISMALAWGDAWTNLVQPFWALPIIGLAKLELKDIMGYCLIFTVVTGVLISAVLYLF